LKNSTNKDFKALTWENEDDIIPKNLARECGKIASLIEGEASKGDEFNIPFGVDFIKSKVKELRKQENEFLAIYTWIDSRSNGRSVANDKNILNCERHLLLYEILFDITIKFLNSTQVKMDNAIPIKSIVINSEFKLSLQNTELLSKAHSKKEIILLDDIFVNPTLSKFESAKENQIDERLDDLIENFKDYNKLIIAGEGQSGKTTIGKILFQNLFDQGYIPILLQDKIHLYVGNIDAKLQKEFKEQYDSEFDLSNFDNLSIVPIIDDFHYAKHKEKHIENLKKYSNQILIVDDIFGLNLREENIIEDYKHFKIVEFSPSLRNELIKNWVLLSDSDFRSENEIYKELDKKTDLVDKALGKIIGSGIMPAFPFFILSVISSYDTFQKPLDQEITSQGHCYQALIYMYLRKEGVNNDEIEGYLNFLTKLSYQNYLLEKNELDETEFNNFLDFYTEKFNLPVPLEELLLNLRKTNILNYNSLGNYSFSYSYLYYFFVAKYFADDIVSNKEAVDKILNNLHKDDNAYIAIFISHHSRNDTILDELVLNAMCLFDSYTPSTLNKDELIFFDEKIKEITEAVLPPAGISPEKSRAELLKKADEIERQKFNETQNFDEEIEDDEFAIEMRRSVKTVEVMGRIIKNRASSLEKERLENIFKEGMNVHLRILTAFIEVIKEEKSQHFIEGLIVSRLNLVIKEKERTPNKEKLESMAKKFFWNINFSIIYSLTDKIIHSLGSDKLTTVISNVCSIQDTPATFIVKHGILMWYNKNLQVENISSRVEDDDFSKTATTIMKHRVVNHSQTHLLDYKAHQKIENRLKIPKNLLLKRK
jgi:uridine kinase